jgi:hypothetical protein
MRILHPASPKGIVARGAVTAMGSLAGNVASSAWSSRSSMSSSRMREGSSCAVNVQLQRGGDLFQR